MKHIDHRSGLLISDSRINPFEIDLPATEDVKRATEGMILSASGWRRVFGAGGDEEADSPNIDSIGVVLAAAAAAAMADHIEASAKSVVVAVDSRPTGPSIADVVIRILLYRGALVRYLFIASTPEVLAYTKLEEEVAGFAYVSASHNPIGHNGFKFGGSDGSVYGAADAERLAGLFGRYLSTDGYQKLCEEIENASNLPASDIDELYATVSLRKEESLRSYTEFSRKVLAGSTDEVEAVFERLQIACRNRGFGVIGELNGSARGASIDRDFLSELGIECRFINDLPGEIVHRIVPEGESLDLCRSELESAHSTNNRFQIGYVPDNDGDRGNLVYLGADGKAEEIHAQALFALACVAELSFLESIEARSDDRIAVVVNGPTSLRVDRIAQLFGVTVVRTEVGESQVVSRAAELRQEGYEVRILGEGSNGGTIIHPSTVRDPLNTITGLLKLLLLPGTRSRPSPLEIWCGRVGYPAKEIESIADLLATLPAFTTTGAYESRAILTLGIPDHGELKRSYEEILPDVWRERKESLRERFNFHSYRVVNYEGTRVRPGVGNRDRSGKERGGLKVIFSDERSIDRGFIWMRGSGTEPVFRVLADLEGNDATGEAELLELQKRIISDAVTRSAK